MEYKNLQKDNTPLLLLLLLVITAGISGCTTTVDNEYLDFPGELYKGKKDTNNTTRKGYVDKKGRNAARSTANRKSRSGRSTKRTDIPVSGVLSGVVRPLKHDDITISNPHEKVSFSAEKMPLAVFINEVYGNILGISFEISPALENRKDGVTLRIGEPVSKRKLYKMATGVLDRFGVSMVTDDSNLLQFVLASKGSAANPPLLVSGRTLPDVPDDHQVVFQTVPLRVVSQNALAVWLKRAYSPVGLEVVGDPTNNSIVLTGPQNIVRQALSAIDLLDRPGFRGKYSALFELAFQSPDDVVKSLQATLQAQGYSVAIGGKAALNASIILLPLKYMNSLLVFAPNKKGLDHIAGWVNRLDNKSPVKTTSTNVFYYEVKNTRADSLVKVLDGLYFGGATSGQTTDDNKSSSTKGSTTVSTSARAVGSLPKKIEGRLMLDEARNAVVFQGEVDDWMSIRQVLAKMDKPVRQVFVEVTIAEVTLTDEDALGVEWLASTGVKNLTGTIGTLGGLGVGGTGLLYSLNNAGQTRFVLNALAKNQKVSILSTPRVLVKSGEQATIEVGSEIPVVTSEASANTTTEGNSDILREVQYRKTGVLLSVTPVIHSGNRVDLQVAQTVSEAKTNTTSSISSPVILNRSVNTSVTLKDGGSVVLAGLISRSTNRGNSGVPVLKDIPGLGKLFNTQRDENERKEMLILIRPYIIDNDEHAYSLTRSIRSKMKMFDLPVLENRKLKLK